MFHRGDTRSITCVRRQSEKQTESWASAVGKFSKPFFFPSNELWMLPCRAVMTSPLPSSVYLPPDHAAVLRGIHDMGVRGTSKDSPTSTTHSFLMLYFLPRKPSKSMLCNLSSMIHIKKKKKKDQGLHTDSMWYQFYSTVSQNPNCNVFNVQC